jgi:hypothetical protein
MSRTYSAILRGDRLEWTGEAPPVTGDESIRVSVEITEPAALCEDTPERRARRLEALARLRELNPFADIEDPVAWQRELRKDRPLPGREP